MAAAVGSDPTVGAVLGAVLLVGLPDHVAALVGATVALLELALVAVAVLLELGLLLVAVLARGTAAVLRARGDRSVRIAVAVRPGMLDMRARVGSVVVPVAQVAAVTVVLAVITHTIVVPVSPHAVAIVAAVMVIADAVPVPVISDAVPVPVMGGRSAGGTFTGGTRTSAVRSAVGVEAVRLLELLVEVTTLLVGVHALLLGSLGLLLRVEACAIGLDLGLASLQVPLLSGGAILVRLLSQFVGTASILLALTLLLGTLPLRSSHGQECDQQKQEQHAHHDGDDDACR